MKDKKNGFTLVEILVSVTIFLIFITLAGTSFISLQKGRILEDNLWQVVSVLRRAQNRSISGEGTDELLHFGVIFKQNNYQEFATLSDYPNRDINFDFLTTLPQTLSFTNINLSDNCQTLHDCIIFSPREGSISSQSSLNLIEQGGKSKTITINEHGQVSY